MIDHAATRTAAQSVRRRDSRGSGGHAHRHSHYAPGVWIRLKKIPDRLANTAGDTCNYRLNLIDLKFQLLGGIENPVDLVAEVVDARAQVAADGVAGMPGLQQFMGWEGPIIADSGGFQVFSLASWNTIDEDGVTFRSHFDGSLIRLTGHTVGWTIICSGPVRRPTSVLALECTTR